MCLQNLQTIENKEANKYKHATKNLDVIQKPPMSSYLSLKRAVVSI